MNVEVGSQRRLERPAVGQLHLGEDDGFHAVKALFGSAEGQDRTSLRHASAFWVLTVPPLTADQSLIPKEELAGVF